MTIESDKELAEAIEKAGSLIQEIQDYVQRDFSKPALLRFPRGFIRTAAQASERFAFLTNSTLKRNIAYTMMLSDVQHWLLVRTDISGMAKKMLIKLQIFLLGSIIESVTKVHLRNQCGKSSCGRTQYLEDQGIISSELRVDLDWLWDIRNRMHLFRLDNIEWRSNDYTIENHNRAVITFKDLLEVLNRS